MRILAIRGQNLASLAQTFAVELASGPLAGVGLFAIAGPVGAGKSTLLDALCLALFDRTPRLSGRGGVLVRDESVVEGDWLRSSDPRTLLRRDAAEGFAEADFTGRDGVTYRARWTVRRARRKADGRVQETQLSLTDLDQGLVIASDRKTEVLAAIEVRLGLDFSQFCRSVLLAQGEFAAFLRASPDERARLLENLTGADIYRKVSRLAHERAKQGQAEVQTLQGQFDAQTLLDAGARAALESQGARIADELQVCGIGIDLATRYVSWYATAGKQRADESVAVVELQQAIAAFAAAEPRRERQARLQRALPCVAHQELVDRRRLEQERSALAVEVANGALAAARERAAAAAAELGKALVALGAGAGAPEAAPPIVREWRRWEPLLQRLAGAVAQQAGLVASLADLEAARRAAETHLAEVGSRLAAAESARLAAAARVAAAQQALGAAEFADLPVRSRRQADARAAGREREQRFSAWSEASERARLAAAQDGPAQQLVRRLAAGFPELVAQRDAAERDLAEVRRERERCRTVAGLLPLRARLADGHACPLCGSLEHPARGGQPDAGLDAAEQAVVAAERRFDAAHRAVLAREAERKQAELERGRAAREREAAAARHQQAETRWCEAVAADRELAALPEPAAVRVVLDARREALAVEDGALQALGERAAQRTAALEQAVQAARAADDAAADARREDQQGRQQLGDAAAVAAKVRAELELLRMACDTHRAALDDAFAGIAGWQDLVASDGAGLLADLRAAAALDERLKQAAAAATEAGRVHELAAAAARRAHEELDTAVRGFAAAAHAAGVAPDDVAEAAQAGAAAIGAEGVWLAELQRAVERTRTVLQERAEQRRAHEQRDRPELDEADAKDALEQARARREEVARRQAEVRGQLLADDAVRRIRGELAPRLAEAAREHETWAALDDLIGSSGGDAFVVFAQGLTLDLLLTEANRRLAEIARRYRVERNHGGEMDFVVVDLDLGGARRSLQTLSGGETFLVSLSLALALATLAAPRSRVETLFLDEGFGTLDAQHLEQALGALDTLQAAGCQVGVISHVEGIAERIGACVDVEPQGGGQSRVRARAR